MTEDSGGRILGLTEIILQWSVIITVSLFVAALIIGMALRLINYRRKRRQQSVILEITPPAFQDKTPLATTQLFSALHGLLKHRSLKDSLMRNTPTVSLEIVSTKNTGIRYLIRCNREDRAVVVQATQAYVTDAHVTEVDDYISPTKELSIQVYRQSNHFAYPIDTSQSINQHDPVSYLTNAMTKLGKSELMSFQMVLTPAIVPQANKIDQRIRQGYLTGSSLQKHFFVGAVFNALLSILRLPFVIIWSMLYGFLMHQLPPSMSSARDSYARSIPPAEQELLNKMHLKLHQDLFYVDLRSVVVASDTLTRKERNRGITNALATYATPEHQVLKLRRNYLLGLGQKIRSFIVIHRLPSLLTSNSCILGASELAALYHFPHSSSARTENVSKSLSKTLPAPISLKSDHKLDIILGNNNHHGQTTSIGLTTAERERHIYIIGGTGNGKTTMLQYGLIQDIQSGKGVAVIDPHGDLASTLLEHIPEHRIKDVIYFNPDDIDYPMSMNLLELPKNLKGSALEREKDRITESVISVLRKIFSEDDSGGHRIEYVLRNAIQTALSTDNPTIFIIFELLTNDHYRKNITNALPAGTLRNFWQNELGKAGAMQRIKMSNGVTSKIGRFEFSPATKRVMGQPTSTLDFDDVLASKKILICNFSKGMLGEDTSMLFGTAVLAKLQLAALKRAQINQTERTPFYLYVDEFQNFATMPFVQMLSEARKYKLFLTMAEQSTAQQDEQRLVNIILANVGTIVCFRTGSPSDEQLMLPLFRPFINQGEIAHLPSFHFYMRISAVHSQEPFSGETIVLREPGSLAVAAEVIKSSRKVYARKYTSVATPTPTKASPKTGTTKKRRMSITAEPIEA